MPKMRFDRQERDKYAVTTEGGDHFGMIQRVGDRFAFVDGRNVRPASGLVPVYSDELEQVADALRQLDDGVDLALTPRSPKS
jgi:hypothetical protein